MNVQVVSFYVDNCPEVFEMEEDLAVSNVDKVPSGTEETCRQVAEDYPVEAIIIDE